MSLRLGEANNSGAGCCGKGDGAGEEGLASGCGMAVTGSGGFSTIFCKSSILPVGDAGG